MRKQSVFVVLALGCVLMSFQNCGGMRASDQQIQNLIETEKRFGAHPEPDTDHLMMPDDPAVLAALNSMGEKIALKGGGGKGGGGSTAPAPSPDPAPAPAAVPSCKAADLKLAWPFGGKAFQDWQIGAYGDLDSTSGTKDYTGATGASALTYDGHRGVDILVPNFRWMDNDFPVLASAGGVVKQIIQDQPDRNLSCATDNWNVVVIQHDNGFKTLYGHLKRNSVTVTVGQRVSAGQKLGVVGSSGCSTYPHVHLEIADCSGNRVEPFKQNMWTSAPVYGYSAPATVMDTVNRQPVLTSILDLVDPGPVNNRFRAGQTFSLGTIIAAAKPGDKIRLELIEPSGAKSPIYFERTFAYRYYLSMWYFDMYLQQQGTWRARWRINGTVQKEESFSIVP